MRQEDCSTLWDPQQKMLDGRMWSVCYVGPQVCSVEQTETVFSSESLSGVAVDQEKYTAKWIGSITCTVFWRWLGYKTNICPVNTHDVYIRFPSGKVNEENRQSHMSSSEKPPFLSLLTVEKYSSLTCPVLF